MPRKMRVMYLVHGYPATSQTYMKTELEAVWDDYDVRIVTNNPRKVELPFRNHLPYENLTEFGQIVEAVQDFKPDVLHTHWLHQIDFVSALARKTDTPFTLRTHSFDVLSRPKPQKPLGKLLVKTGLRQEPGRKGLLTAPGKLRDAVPHVKDDLCLGMIAFPFVRPRLEAAGMPSAKIHDCFPVVNYELFHDRSPNGEAVMNTGAGIAKKRMDDFIRLGSMVPDRQFDLYALGHQVDELARLNEQLGRPVRMVPPVDPDDMLPEYKKHQWCVYTASKEIGTVGWPLTVAEAQAAGVGVCMQNIRPDVRDFVGDGGVVFDSVEEIVDIVSKPVPEEMREKGFEQAKKSDVREHLPVLTDLWGKVGAGVA